MTLAVPAPKKTPGPGKNGRRTAILAALVASPYPEATKMGIPVAGTASQGALKSKPAEGLRDKLVRVAVLLIGSLGVVIGVIVGIIQVYVEQMSSDQLKEEIERTMLARGRSLAVSHADVFRGFVRDTALTEVQHTLALTVQQEDVVYGVFTDENGRPWAYCSPTSQCAPHQGLARLQVVDVDDLARDIGLKAPLLPQDRPEERRLEAFGDRIVEFGEPVRVEGELSGMLRYGISSRKLERAWEYARAQRQTQSVITLLSVAGVVSAAMVFAIALARRLAFKITRPLEDLTEAADALAHGDRNASVTITSHDELEVLGSAFNRMVVDLRVSYSALEENNQALAREIDERRQAQAERTELQDHLIQSQKMEAFGQLAGGVAHDFNNILAVIVGNSELLGELLKETGVDRDILSFNQIIQDAAEKGANLTRQLLTFARKETDNPRAIDVNELLHGFEKLIRRLVEEHITISFNRAERAPKIYADAGRIEQVLMNLCVNARDAMPNGGALTVSTSGVHLEQSRTVTTGLVPKGHYLLIEAQDTGTGMSPEVIARVFEPFFTTKPAGQGTGLGLATIHGIVRAAGGAIDIDSELGHGTTFRIYFPAYETELFDEQASRALEIPQGSGQTVLLCEDEETVRAMTEHILNRGGYDVISVGDPRDALAALKRQEVALLITDVIMPAMDGSQLCSEAQKIQPNLPVLFVSGYTAGVLAAQKLEENGLNFLRKPYRAKVLLERAYCLVSGDRPSTSGDGTRKKSDAPT